MGFFQKEKRARSAPSLPGAFTPLWSEHLSGGVLYLGPIYGATARQQVPFRGNGRNASANIR